MSTQLPPLAYSQWPGCEAAGAAPVAVQPARTAAGPSPPRLLLLHGLGSNATSWREFVPAAEPGFAVWVADLPWRGTGVPGWTSRPAEDWIELAISGVPGGPDVVMAHSFATCALLAWLDQQGRAAASLPGAVILVSPLYRAAADDFDWESMAFYFNSFDRILADGLQARPGRRLAADRLHAVAQKARDLIGPYGWMRFFDSYLRTPSLCTGQLRMPFLIIGGDADFVAAPADARALGQALPDAAVHILPGHGHFPMLAAGDSFAALANDFLRANRTRLRPAARPDREHIR